jgi:membrane-anchored glycerophosphoryl diester phosphodiesterase (GDPDase)
MDNKINKLRKNYFALRDTLYHDCSTGYTVIELHKLFISYLFPLLIDEEGVFNVEYDNVVDVVGSQFSTRWLTERGWSILINEFKNWSQENFNVSLW